MDARRSRGDTFTGIEPNKFIEMLVNIVRGGIDENCSENYVRRWAEKFAKECKITLTNTPIMDWESIKKNKNLMFRIYKVLAMMCVSEMSCRYVHCFNFVMSNLRKWLKNVKTNPNCLVNAIVELTKVPKSNSCLYFRSMMIGKDESKWRDKMDTDTDTTIDRFGWKTVSISKKLVKRLKDIITKPEMISYDEDTGYDEDIDEEDTGPGLGGLESVLVNKYHLQLQRTITPNFHSPSLRGRGNDENMIYNENRKAENRAYKGHMANIPKNVMIVYLLEKMYRRLLTSVEYKKEYEPNKAIDHIENARILKFEYAYFSARFFEPLEKMLKEIAEASPYGLPITIKITHCFELFSGQVYMPDEFNILLSAVETILCLKFDETTAVADKMESYGTATDSVGTATDSVGTATDSVGPTAVPEDLMSCLEGNEETGEGYYVKDVVSPAHSLEGAHHYSDKFVDEKLRNETLAHAYHTKKKEWDNQQKKKRKISEAEEKTYNYHVVQESMEPTSKKLKTDARSTQELKKQQRKQQRTAKAATVFTPDGHKRKVLWLKANDQERKVEFCLYERANNSDCWYNREEDFHTIDSDAFYTRYYIVTQIANSQSVNSNNKEKLWSTLKFEKNKEFCQAMKNRNVLHLESLLPHGVGHVTYGNFRDRYDWEKKQLVSDKTFCNYYVIEPVLNPSGVTQTAADLTREELRQVLIYNTHAAKEFLQILTYLLIMGVESISWANFEFYDNHFYATGEQGICDRSCHELMKSDGVKDILEFLEKNINSKNFLPRWLHDDLATRKNVLDELEKLLDVSFVFKPSEYMSRTDYSLAIGMMEVMRQNVNVVHDLLGRELNLITEKGCSLVSKSYTSDFNAKPKISPIYHSDLYNRQERFVNYDLYNKIKDLKKKGADIYDDGLVKSLIETINIMHHEIIMLQCDLSVKVFDQQMWFEGCAVLMSELNHSVNTMVVRRRYSTTRLQYVIKCSTRKQIQSRFLAQYVRKNNIFHLDKPWVKNLETDGLYRCAPSNYSDKCSLKCQCPDSERWNYIVVDSPCCRVKDLRCSSDMDLCHAAIANPSSLLELLNLLFMRLMLGMGGTNFDNILVYNQHFYSVGENDAFAYSLVDMVKQSGVQQIFHSIRRVWHNLTVAEAFTNWRYRQSGTYKRIVRELVFNFEKRYPFKFSRIEEHATIIMSVLSDNLDKRHDIDLALATTQVFQTTSQTTPDLEKEKKKKKKSNMKMKNEKTPSLKHVPAWKRSNLIFEDDKRVNYVCNATSTSVKPVVFILEGKNDGEIWFAKAQTKGTNYGLDQELAHAIKLNNILEFAEPLLVPKNKPMRRICKDIELVTTTKLIFKKVDNDVIEKAGGVWYTVRGALDVNDCTRACHNYTQLDQILSEAEGVVALLQILIFRLVLGIPGTSFSNVLMSGGRLYSVEENKIGEVNSSFSVYRNSNISKMLEKLREKTKLVQKDTMYPEWFSNKVTRDRVKANLQTVLTEGKIRPGSILVALRNLENVVDVFNKGLLKF